MPSTKVRACSTLKEMNPEQDNIDSLIRQAIGKDPFLSFSRVADRPIQLIQLLNAFEQQGSDKLSKSSKGNSYDLKENSDNIFNGVNSFTSELNGIKDPAHSKGCMSNAKGTKCTPAQIPSRKIPEAVVAFAQAAAKATGEPEKSDLPGWPLLSPSKAQLQKCDKCSREFCSSINYRRHRRIHRRSLNVDKDSTKTREFLGAFWDKLSLEKAKELVSLRNETVEEITCSSVTKALSTWFRRPGMLSTLPQVYVKAGLTLLDVVQASPSMLPISSQGLFSVLDEASEKTFLCAGTALSLQKYIFDVEAVKKALEIKNVVACTSFLIEIELVKAWLVDKDAEALRCQKLLVDEEEAAQRRQTEILERKRLKKLRQKEQKVKEISNGEKIDFNVPSLNYPPDCTGSADTSSSRALSEDCTSEPSQNLEQQFDSAESSAAEDDMNAEKRRSGQTDIQNFSHCEKGPDLPFYPEDAAHEKICQIQNAHEKICQIQNAHEKICRIQNAASYMLPKHSWHVNSRLNQNTPHVFQVGHASASKPLASTWESNSRDSKVIARANGRKVWTIKSKPDNEENGKYGKDIADREVLIGSINVSLGSGDLHHPCTNLEPQIEENHVKPDSSSSNLAKTTMRLWRPVSRHGNGTSAQNVHDDGKADVSTARAAEQNIPYVRSLNCKGNVSDLERGRGAMMFSSEVAKAFLTQRWKEAIAGEEVVVISSPETEASESPDTIDGNFGNPSLPTSNFHGRHILGRVENRLAGAGAIDTAASTASLHLKFKPKNDKNKRLKYVPKQKSIGAGE